MVSIYERHSSSRRVLIKHLSNRYARGCDDSERSSAVLQTHLVATRRSIDRYHGMSSSGNSQASNISKASRVFYQEHSQVTQEEGTEVSLRTLQRLCLKFQTVHTIEDLPRGRCPRILTVEMGAMMEQCLRNDDELTARKLKALLTIWYPDLKVSLSTVKRWRKEKGWVCTRPHFCQLIREMNKVKRKE